MHGTIYELSGGNMCVCFFFILEMAFSYNMFTICRVFRGDADEALATVLFPTAFGYLCLADSRLQS